MASEDSPRAAAAYMPWGTFTNALDALAKNNHLPNRIDRTVFPGQSGGVQSQLISGFKFLGLIAEDGRPTGLLQVAVTDEAARKSALRKLFEEKYADLLALNLQKTTPQQLGEQMTASYNVSGDTREKSIRFFLAGVKYLGIPASPFLSREAKAANGTATPRRRRRQRDAIQRVPEMVSAGEGESRSITLKSGGMLTLSASARFFDLERSDRDFVFELLDRLRAYEQSLNENSQ